MTHKYLFGATVAVFAFGVVTVGPAYAQRRDGGLLPQETSGDVTAVGCLVRGTAVRGGQKDKYVLARVKKGPVASVPEATCTVEPGADALTVDNPEKGKITDAALGRWVEITGRLERETDKDPDNLRELDVATFKLVPVVIPTPPAAAPHRHRPHGQRHRHRHRPHGQRSRWHPHQRQPQSPRSCRRRRARFPRLDWPDCSPLQQVSCFVRSVSGKEVDASSRVPSALNSTR